MTRELKIGTWKLLRALVRKGPQTGRELRQYDYTRRSKDGTFLDDLVALGFIRAVSVNPDDTQPGYVPKPVQFRTVYELTDLGLVAAEYGEYQYERPIVSVPARKASRKKS